RGDAAYYQGDLKLAKSSYEQALQSASHSSDKDALLRSRRNLDKVAISEGNPRPAITDLRSLAQQADSQGRMYASLVASVLLSDGLVAAKDYPSALRDLQRDLGRSEKLGTRLQSARIHYLLGTVLRQSGKASEATAQLLQAKRILDEIGKEPGAEDLAKRY